MQTFEVEYDFSIGASTRGYTMRADSPEEALKKAESCIDEHGYLNLEKFEALGGDTSKGTWDTHDGSDYAYEVSEVFPATEGGKSSALPVAVVVEATQEVIARFTTVDAAERYVGTLPDAETGAYGIDAPEEMVQRRTDHVRD